MRATTQNSSLVWLSLPALILPQNSSISASGWPWPRNELVLGNSLSSIQTPAISRWHSLRTRRRILLKLPNPVSPSIRIGIEVASDMNSRISSTWVQDASLLSRTPSAVAMDRPDAQTPRNPASSTILEDSPSWASIRKLSLGDFNCVRSCAAFESLEESAGAGLSRRTSIFVAMDSLSRLGLDHLVRPDYRVRSKRQAGSLIVGRELGDFVADFSDQGVEALAAQYAGIFRPVGGELTE